MLQSDYVRWSWACGPATWDEKEDAGWVSYRANERRSWEVELVNGGQDPVRKIDRRRM